MGLFPFVLTGFRRIDAVKEGKLIDWCNIA